MAALRGQRLWRIVLNGENVGTVTSHFNGTFGRLRAVVKVPGENAIWIGTTNADNNGGDPDGSGAQPLSCQFRRGFVVQSVGTTEPRQLAVSAASSTVVNRPTLMT